MKKLVLLLLLAGYCAGVTGWTQQSLAVRTQVQPPSFVGYVPNEFVVKFKANVSALTVKHTPQATVVLGVPSVDALNARFAVSDMRKQFEGAASGSMSRYVVAKFEGKANVADVVAAYRQNPMVEKAEPIGIHAVYATPNDTWFRYQWHLDQPTDHDVDAQTAWDIQTGKPGIIVALMDTGVRYYHKDLGGSDASSTNVTAANGNMWINLAEKNGAAKVDDDGNGYVDDWIGWDWVYGTTRCWSGEDCKNPDNDPRDFNGHGTHCAGNVAAMNNNGYGTCAVAGGWGYGTNTPSGTGVKIMALRVGWSAPYQYQEAGFVRMDFVASALYYAARNGAKIASCSWGSSNSGGVAEAVDTFVARGGLIFKAAGNDNTQTADYLCSRSDVISVAATDESDCKASFSTYGSWVDICAPGVGIISSYHDHYNPDNDYVASLDGTSMSTPIAASVAAAIWSRHPTWTASQVKARLLATADPIDALSCNGTYAGKLGAGRVNAFNALNDGPPCDVVAVFSASSATSCAGQQVAFTDQSTGPMLSWHWDFGDGQISTLQNPTHQYASAGSYTVTLQVTSSTCTSTSMKPDYLKVTTTPTAAFAGVPTTGYAPLPVAFTDQSTGATAWNWSFGDGGVSTEQSPAHTYQIPGMYTVSLTVSNTCGTNTITKAGYVTVTQAPALQCDNFSDGSASDWTDLTGLWYATGYYLRGNSSTADAHVLAPFGNYAIGTIDCDVRMNAGRRLRVARLIFGYIDDKNYRFVEGEDSLNVWRIGERVGGVNTIRGEWAQPITSAIWYHVQAKLLADSSVSFAVAGTTVGSFKFPSLIAGKVGCGYSSSVSDFDNFCLSSGVAVASDPTIVSVAKAQLSSTPELSQNHPNPFNPSTTIAFNLPSAGRVTLEIYNVLGEKVASLLDGDSPAGQHEVVWDASALASGVYFYRLKTTSGIQTRKMLLLK